MRQFLCSPAREEASQQENILSVLTYIGHLYFDEDLERYFIPTSILLPLTKSVKPFNVNDKYVRDLVWCGLVLCTV